MQRLSAGLAGDLRLESCQSWHTCGACRGAEESCQLLHYRTKFQASQAVSSRFELPTQLSHEVKSPDHPVWEKLTFHIPSHLTIYIHTLIPTIFRELLKRILREKPQRKTRLIHSQSSHRNFSNSSTLFLSIVKSLRGTL